MHWLRSCFWCVCTGFDRIWVCVAVRHAGWSVLVSVRTRAQDAGIEQFEPPSLYLSWAFSVIWFSQVVLVGISLHGFCVCPAFGGGCPWPARHCLPVRCPFERGHNGQRMILSTTRARSPRRNTCTVSLLRRRSRSHIDSRAARIRSASVLVGGRI